MNPRQARDILDKVVANIQHVILGKEIPIRQALTCWLAGGHVLFEDVPGTGKTILARAMAASVHVRTRRIQFTPDLLPSDIIGTAVFSRAKENFVFVPGPIFTSVLLADEINRATPRTQSALLQAMAEGQCTAENKTYNLPETFFVIATQNPVEQQGTFPLPEAQLDRFLIKCGIGYPTEKEEADMLHMVTHKRIGDGLEVKQVNTIIKPETIVALQALVAQISVDEAVANYAVRIVRATRDCPGIAVGAGPRGSIALIRIARAFALLAKRDFVTPDDIKSACLPVLRHRVALSPESELDGLSSDSILANLIEQIPAPRA